MTIYTDYTEVTVGTGKDFKIPGNSISKHNTIFNRPGTYINMSYTYLLIETILK